MEPCIQTYTGRKFFPLNPRAEDICVEDIAHSLSLKCRFGGHCLRFYSVAQHCVLVSKLLEPAEESTLLWGLLHDAAEAYIPDFAAPIKHQFFVSQDCFLTMPDGDKYPIGQIPIKYIEGQINYGIQIAFNLQLQSCDHRLIKLMDLKALATERYQLMSEGFEWGGLKEIEPAEVRINPLIPQQAEELFLKRFLELTR